MHVYPNIIPTLEVILQDPLLRTWSWAGERSDSGPKVMRTLYRVEYIITLCRLVHKVILAIFTTVKKSTIRAIMSIP